MSNRFVFYIYSEILNENKFDDLNIDNHIKTISPLLDVARHLKANVYYCSSDVIRLKEEFNLDEYFTQSQANKLDVLLQDFMINDQINHLFRVHFSGENTSIEPFKFKLCNTNKEQIAILFTLSLVEELYLLKVESNNSFEKIKFYSVFNKENIWEIINKQIKRKYNFSSKHGDKNHIAISPNGEKVSQLLCSEEETQKLLDESIFDLRHKEWFYNFDNDKNTYIIFPFEGKTPQNQYHAFHISEDEWDKEIPNSIRKYFDR